MEYKRSPSALRIMFVLFVQIVWVISIGIIALLAARKMPALVVLPEAVETEEKKKFFRKVFRRNRPVKPKPYTSQEMKEKTAALIKDKKDQIDIDADYWQEITSS